MKIVSKVYNYSSLPIIRKNRFCFQIFTLIYDEFKTLKMMLDGERLSRSTKSEELVTNLICLPSGTSLIFFQENGHFEYSILILFIQGNR